MNDTPAIRHFNSADAPGHIRHVLNAIVAPRPIAWVGSLAPNGAVNLAPHSYTTIFGVQPPIVGFVSTGKKDTLQNIADRGEFVYHVAGEELGEKLNLTSADFPREISELEFAGLTPVPSDLIETPHLLEAEIAIECRLHDIIEIRQAGSWLVLGEALRFHVHELVIEHERIAPWLIRPLSRLAGNDYSTFGAVLKMERPTYQGLMLDGATSLEDSETEG